LTARPQLTDHERRTIDDIIDFSRSAARRMARGRRAYDHNEMLPLAAEAVLHRVGEAVARLPETLTADHPEVRWRPMRGMRNRIAHEYEGVDPVIVWSTLVHKLPVDTAAIRAILDGAT
jgi:uncharacterized protein with HEPN domain